MQKRICSCNFLYTFNQKSITEVWRENDEEEN
jgi:hypothetical protein